MLAVIYAGTVDLQGPKGSGDDGIRPPQDWIYTPLRCKLFAMPKHVECPRCGRRVLERNFPHHQSMDCRISPAGAAILSDLMDPNMTREEFKDWYDRLFQYFDNEVAMDTIVQTVRVEVDKAEIPSFVGHLERSVKDLQESKQTFDLRRADYFLDLIRTLAQP